MGTERRRGWSAPGWGWPWTDGRKAGRLRRGSGRVAQLPARPPRARIVTRGHRQICHNQPGAGVGAPEQSCSYMRPQGQGPRRSCSPHTANRRLYVETQPQPGTQARLPRGLRCQPGARGRQEEGLEAAPPPWQSGWAPEAILWAAGLGKWTRLRLPSPQPGVRMAAARAAITFPAPGEHWGPAGQIMVRRGSGG